MQHRRGMQTLSCGMHAGSSSLIRDQTQAPCIGSVNSYPLDHQGSPKLPSSYKDTSHWIRAQADLIL